jgi:hypothetical protein
MDRGEALIELNNLAWLLLKCDDFPAAVRTIEEALVPLDPGDRMRRRQARGGCYRQGPGQDTGTRSRDTVGHRCPAPVDALRISFG